MKYIITESKLVSAVGKYFSMYIDLDKISVIWGQYHGDDGYEPTTRYISFIYDNGDERDWQKETESIFLGGNESDEELDVSNPPNSLDDVPSKEDIARYTVCVYDDTMADKFNEFFGEGNWEESLMHYFNHKLGTNFSSFTIEMI